MILIIKKYVKSYLKMLFLMIKEYVVSKNLESRIKIYRENYEYLPKRFVDKIDADIDYIVKADIPGLKGVYLFGSCARGELKSTSDVDMLIITEKKLEDRMLASDIRWTLAESKSGISTDLVYMNEESVEEDTVFKKAVRRDRKIILEVM